MYFSLRNPHSHRQLLWVKWIMGWRKPKFFWVSSANTFMSAYATHGTGKQHAPARSVVMSYRRIAFSGKYGALVSWSPNGLSRPFRPFGQEVTKTLSAGYHLQ